MKQQTLAMANGFEGFGKKTRHTLSPAEVGPGAWSELCAPIEPVPAKEGNGRPPVGAERMLRNYWSQQRSNLPHPGVEEALYDFSRKAAVFGIDLGREREPDETTHTSRSTGG